MRKEYLGDSVYVEYDGYGFELTTNNGEGPTNTIYLEPEVLDTFVKFAWQTLYGKNNEIKECEHCGHIPCGCGG